MSNLLTLETAEMSIIGAMLIDDRCVGDVLTAVRAEDFVTPRYRQLFKAVQELFALSIPIDPVTLLDRAGAECQKAITECMDVTPTAANVAYYCGVLREQAALYRLRQAAEELAEAQSVEQAQAILVKAESALTDRPGVTVMSITQMMASFFQRLGAPSPDYLKWGLGMLDGALHTAPGSYVLLGARPSTGKTALALQLGLNIAETKRVGFFSLETGPAVAGDRLAAGNLSVTLPDIKARRVDASWMQALASEAGRKDEFKRPFDFISCASMSVPDIRSLALANKYDVVIIDYVQLLRSTSRGERTEQMQSVSMELRAMTQLTGITVIALAQLRRPEAGTKPKAPTMADLKESGQFEQDADTVLLMYKHEADNNNSDRWLKIEKNKEGYAGLVNRYRFDGKKQRFIPVEADGRMPETKFEELDDGQEEIPGVWK